MLDGHELEEGSTRKQNQLEEARQHQEEGKEEWNPCPPRTLWQRLRGQVEEGLQPRLWSPARQLIPCKQGGWHGGRDSSSAAEKDTRGTAGHELPMPTYKAQASAHLSPSAPICTHLHPSPPTCEAQGSAPPQVAVLQRRPCQRLSQCRSHPFVPGACGSAGGAAPPGRRGVTQVEGSANEMRKAWKKTHGRGKHGRRPQKEETVQ